jgi:hypothetical protein
VTPFRLQCSQQQKLGSIMIDLEGRLAAVMAAATKLAVQMAELRTLRNRLRQLARRRAPIRSGARRVARQRAKSAGRLMRS